METLQFNAQAALKPFNEELHDAAVELLSVVSLPPNSKLNWSLLCQQTPDVRAQFEACGIRLCALMEVAPSRLLEWQGHRVQLHEYVNRVALQSHEGLPEISHRVALELSHLART